MALSGGERSNVPPDSFTLGKNFGTQWPGGWLEPAAGVDVLENRNSLLSRRDSNSVSYGLSPSCYTGVPISLQTWRTNTVGYSTTNSVTTNECYNEQFLSI